jgi:hypothetical protein
MSITATPKDAELIMQLYDLRREAELRKARDWWLTKFWPDTADDFLKIAWSLGSQENNWLRQGGAYWSMAAMFAISGAVNIELFLQPAVSGEMFFMLAKVHPMLGELREKLGDAEFFSNIEKAINSTQYGRDRFAFIQTRVAAAKQRMAAAKS